MQILILIIIVAILTHLPCQSAQQQQQQRSIPPREWTHFPVWSNSGRFVAVTWPAPDMVKPDGTIVRIENKGLRTLRGPIVMPASALPQNGSMPSFLSNFDRRKTLILHGKTFQQQFPPIATYLYGTSWSPNEELIAGQDSRNNHGAVFNVKTGKIVFKIPNAQSQCYSWSPDGKRLAVSQMTEVEIWDVYKKCLAVELPEVKDLWRAKITWAKDGKQIAVFGSKQTGDSQIGEMRICNALDGKSVFQKQSTTGFGQAVWTEDGKYFIYSDETLHFLNPATLEEEFHLVTEGKEEPIDFSLSPDQKLIAYKGCDSLLHIFDLTSKAHIRDIQGDKSGNFRFLWTPDSVGILLKSNTDMVAVCNVSTGNFEGAKQLDDFALYWTPDGKSLVRMDSRTEAIVLEPCDLSKRTTGKSVFPGGTLENPWKDQRVPRNLEDCFVELEKLLGPQQVAELKKTSEDGLCQYTGGPGLGMQLRNLWGLRGHTPLVKYFNSYGITNGATMSELIIECYWKKLNSMPVDLRAEVDQLDTKWQSRMEKYSKQKKE